jgi:pSer/pThr/pTyr-binding forkhead associated (FHA) protein
MPTCHTCGQSHEAGQSACPNCGAATGEPTASFMPVDEGAAQGAIPAEESAESPVLVVRKGPQLGERFYLESPRLAVGRDPDSDIFLNDVTVSRIHAYLDVSADSVSVSDAGSLNGTYVNGICVEASRLHSGDVVQIGTFQMVFFAGKTNPS